MRITSHPLRGPSAAEALQAAPALNTRFRSHLRFVEPGDAAFICRLRADSTPFRRAAPPSELTTQRRWIERYKSRQAAGLEFYFVIVSEARNRGLIRLYDFRDIAGEPSFRWGNWAIQPPVPASLVIFSAITMHELGFNTLGYPRAHVTVPRANGGLLDFHLRAGADLEFEDADNLHFCYRPAGAANFRAREAAATDMHRPMVVPA